MAKPCWWANFFYAVAGNLTCLRSSIFSDSIAVIHFTRRHPIEKWLFTIHLQQFDKSASALPWYAVSFPKAAKFWTCRSDSCILKPEELLYDEIWSTLLQVFDCNTVVVFNALRCSSSLTTVDLIPVASSSDTSPLLTLRCHCSLGAVR